MWSPAVYFNNVLSTLLLSVGQLDVVLSTVGSLCLIVVLLRGTFSPVSLRPYLPLTSLARVYVALASNGELYICLIVTVCQRTLLQWRSCQDSNLLHPAWCRPANTRISIRLLQSSREREFLKDFFGKMPFLS